MLPVQIDEQGMNQINGERGRRAFLLMFTLIGILLVIEAVQENMLEYEEEDQESYLDTSICNKMKLNITEMLISNHINYTNSAQKQCFNFMLLRDISPHLYRGTWQNDQQTGQFQFQAILHQEHLNKTLILRTTFFRGKYQDDPRSSFMINFNETDQENVTYDGYKREIKFKSQNTTHTTVNPYIGMIINKGCLIDLTIKFLDVNDPKRSVHSQAKLLITMNASECEQGLIVSVEATQQNKDYQRKTFIYSCFMSIIPIIQIVSTLRMLKQLLESNVQAEHYSLLSIAMITAQDAYFSIIHFYLAINIEAFFHQFITPAFLYFLLFSVFEMRLLIIVWKIRQDYFLDDRFQRDSLVKFYLSYYLFMFTMSYLLYQYALHSWFIMLMSFFLVPQIIHNARRGQHQRMDKIYTFGLLSSRVLIILYFKGCPDNMFEFRPNTFLCIFILVSVATQAYIYYLQEKRGPRFFIPKIFLPKRFNYFVVVPTQIDLEEELSQEVQGLFAEECSVCMNPLHQIPATQLTEQEEMNIYLKQVLDEGRGKIMKTPCDHKFHTLCLAKWMNIKMSCPSCRNILPAI